MSYDTHGEYGAADPQAAIADKLHALALSGKTDQWIDLGQRHTLIIKADPSHPKNDNEKIRYAFFALVCENEVPDETGADRIVLQGTFQADIDGRLWFAFHECERGAWEAELLAA